MTPKHEVYMIRATLVSLFCNIVLVLIKSTALILVNSLAIAIDLGISFVGLAVSVILYYSIRLSNRPADQTHNYGYGKVEHVCEALEGVVLIGIAFAMSSQAIVSLFHPEHIKMPFFGLITSVINSSINFGGAYYIFKMANKSASPAIKAEGVHYRMEGFISGMIAVAFTVGIILRSQGLNNVALYVDPLTALFVSILIIVPSFKLAKHAFFKLLDASVEEDSQIEILRQLSKYIHNYCEFKDLRTRTAGRTKFVEFSLVVPAEISLKKGHEIVAHLEDDIQKHISNAEVNIRMLPCKMDCEFARKKEPCPYEDSPVPSSNL